MTTYQPAEHSPSESKSRPTVVRKRVQRNRDRNSWRTSTLPAAVAIALLTGLAAAVALGFRELVGLAMSVMGS